MTPERWEAKFTSQPGDYTFTRRPRYWVRTDWDGNPIALLRLIVNDETQTLAEQVWDRRAETWVDAGGAIFAAMAGGDVFLDEVGPDVAERLFPAALAGPPS